MITIIGFDLLTDFHFGNLTICISVGSKTQIEAGFERAGSYVQGGAKPKKTKMN